VDWLHGLWGDFFSRGPKKKKICCQNKIADQKKKRSLNNYKGPLPLPPQKKICCQNKIADQKETINNYKGP
jgi:hypothetical protein